MTRPIRVVHLATGRSYRGGERQVHWLHEGLLAKGLESELVCRRGSALAGTGLDAVSAIAWSGTWDLPGSLRILTRIRTSRANLLHCHDSHALLHGAFVSVLSGVPLIATRRVLFRLRSGSMATWKYRRCRAVIAISQAVAKQLECAVPVERIALVHSGVRWGEDELSGAEARAALKVPEDAFAIGTVGYFSGEKRPGLMRSVAERLAASHPHARLVCIGPASKAHFEGLRNVILAGTVENPARYYAAFDAYLSLSRKEGLGTSLLDAVVRDIPAVATDAGGTRDIFPAGHRLVSADADDVARRLGGMIDDGGVACEEARVAGARAREEFSVQQMVDGALGVYSRIVEDLPDAH